MSEKRKTEPASNSPCRLTLLLERRARDRSRVRAAFRRIVKPIGVLALTALWFLGLVAGMVGGARALPAWWKLGCERGHPYACHAASGGVTSACPRAP